MTKRKDDENPLLNIFVNVLLPIVALSQLSKSGDKSWHIGPEYGMAVAVAFPFIYGVVFFFKNKKFNFYSVLGIISVLLTGFITIHVWNEDGSIKENADLLFAIKEAAIPLMLGAAMLYSHRTKNPLIDVFFLNPDIFDITKIEETAKEKNTYNDYLAFRLKLTWMFASSFLLSSLLNFILAMYLLKDANDKESYNLAVGKVMGYGYLVIGIPLMIIMVGCLIYLMKTISRITGLTKEEFMMPK
ncbi:MAG: VC0807 family protein [Verrucomicrobiota bacterium]|nr:VC0807 family protein [Verrucomicrobiota bacterium]MEC8691797.1 VC0807 family protein [Verrucomicrobiota bacterium]